MHTVDKLGVALTRLPASASHPGVNAGLTFTAPRSLPPLLHGRSEWIILSKGIQRLAEGVADLTPFPGVSEIARKLSVVATSFPGAAK